MNLVIWAFQSKTKFMGVGIQRFRNFAPFLKPCCISYPVRISKFGGEIGTYHTIICFFDGMHDIGQFTRGSEYPQFVFPDQCIKNQFARSPSIPLPKPGPG